MSGEVTRDSARQHALSSVALIALVLAVVGLGLAIWGFVSGIDETLNGAGAIGTSIVIFYVGSSVLFVALVLSVIGLVFSNAKLIPTIALVVALIPLAAIIVVALANRR